MKDELVITEGLSEGGNKLATENASEQVALIDVPAGPIANQPEMLNGNPLADIKNTRKIESVEAGISRELIWTGL